jgi:hypothetical protein
MDYMREEVHKLAQESRVRVANYCQRVANFVHSVDAHSVSSRDNLCLHLFDLV